jgi:predicted amidohydrolase YtcJ
MQSPPALALLNGRVYTLDRQRPVADALFAWQGRVAHAGTAAEVRALAGQAPGAQTIDLQGGCAVPGLTDSHIHLLSYGLNLSRVPLSGLTSREAALERVGAAAQAALGAAAGAWVEGWGWDHSLWPERRFPDRAALDAVAPGVPVALRRKDGHMVWVNGAALATAGVTRGTPDPEGGRIGRDEHGEPDGLLFERAQDLIFRAIPPPSEAQAEGGAREAQAALHRMGVTGVHIPEGAQTLRALQGLSRAGALRLRTNAMLPYSGLDAALELGLRSGLGDDWLRIGPVKLFMDGSLGSETAAMLEPFAGSEHNRGILTLGIDEVREALRRAAEGGLACAVHAIGDRANRIVLDAFEATREAWGPRGLRQRIEHVQVLHPDDLPRFAALGVLASVQPIHATQDKDLVDRLWGARGRYAYAFRSLLDHGARLAFGSDAPVETPDPLAGLYAAVARRRADGDPEGGWYPEERISLEVALRAYTTGAAYAAGLEEMAGTLGPGKWADVTCLSRDVLREPAEALLETTVTHTVVGGEVVYSAS